MADKTQFPGEVVFKKALTQEAASVVSAKGGTPGYGVHEAAFEIDLGAVTYVANENTIIKSIATLPADARVLESALICTEAFSDNNQNNPDLVITSSPQTASELMDDDVAALITGFDLSNDAQGALGGSTSGGAVASGGAAATSHRLSRTAGLGRYQPCRQAGMADRYHRILAAAGCAVRGWWSPVHSAGLRLRPSLIHP